MKRKAKRIVRNFHKPASNNVEISVRNNNGSGTSMPPSFTNVEIYFDQKNVREVAFGFYKEHELREWKSVTGRPVTNWKVCAAEWIYNYRQDMKRRLRQSPFYSGSF